MPGVARAFALDHIVLVVSDIEKTLEWYQRFAGLADENVDAWRDGKAPFPSLRVDESTIIDFIAGHDGARGHLDHVCFVVSGDDLEKLKGELTVVSEGPRSGARGIAHSIYVRDPDDLLVEFRSYP
jgi:catechol 2,3-dioxygenase-like lactoylglutathione lyase family enzyme